MIGVVPLLPVCALVAWTGKALLSFCSPCVLYYKAAHAVVHCPSLDTEQVVFAHMVYFSHNASLSCYPRVTD